MFVRDVKDQSTNVIRVGKKKNPEGRVLAQFMNLMAVLAPPSPDPLAPGRWRPHRRGVAS